MPKSSKYLFKDFAWWSDKYCMAKSNYRLQSILLNPLISILRKEGRAEDEIKVRILKIHRDMNNSQHAIFRKKDGVELLRTIKKSKVSFDTLLSIFYEIVRYDSSPKGYDGCMNTAEALIADVIGDKNGTL